MAHGWICMIYISHFVECIFFFYIEELFQGGAVGQGCPRNLRHNVGDNGMDLRI